MKTPHVLAGAAASAAAVLFLIVPLITNAKPVATWTVDGNPADVCTTASPTCTTIQQAVTASSNGDTIDVNAGTYNAGFSVINKTNLTIVGSGNGTGKNATIIEPSSLIPTGVGHKYTANMHVSVFVNNSSGITLKNMRIEGNLQTPGSGGADALVFWNASTGTLQNLAVAGNYTIDGVQTGQGIAVDGGTTVLTIKSTDISGFQKNGVDVEDGNDGTTGPGSIAVTVQNGNITGAGATGVIAQNGIVAWNEGGGAVTASDTGTNFSNLDYTGAGDTAGGVLAYGAASIPTVSNATFTNVQQYIDSASSGKAVDATGGNTFDGVIPASATTAQLGTIENKINGEMETSGADPIFLLPHTWIVTTQNLGVQTGINDASSGDIVLVTPGSYSGNFSVNKSIVLDGAQFGQPVSSRTFNSADESTLSGNTNGTGVLTITGPNVTVDGFSITDARPAFAAYGVVIKNGGDNATIQNNLFDTITSADTGVNGTAQAIYFEGNVNGVQILNNSINNVQSVRSAKGILFGDNGGTDNATNATVEGNTISNVTSTTKGAYGISFGNTTSGQSGVTIEDNTITGLNGGGWAHGIGVEGNTPGLDIASNTFSNFTSPAPIAIWFESEDQASFTGATVIDNNLDLSSSQVGVGVDPALTGGTVNAQQNWWNDQTGPTDTTSTDGSIPATNPHGVGSTAYGAVQYGDWCTNAACTSFSNVTVPTPSPVSPADGTVTTTAALTSVNWTSVSDAYTPTTYNYEVSNSSATNGDGSFTTPVYSQDGLTTNSINTSGTPDGTYYWHVQAEDYLGNVSSWSTTSSFTVDNTPSVVTVAANPVDDTDATVNGTVGPIAADNTSFWWGTTNAGPFTSGSAPTPPAGWQHDSGLTAEGANANFDESLTNLVPGTTYYFVAWIESNGTWYPGTVLSFTTTGTTPSPSVTTDAATGIDQTDATVNAQNGGLPADNTSFWWGTTPISGTLTSGTNPGATEFPASGWQHDSGLGSAGANATFNEPLSGLTPDTQYYFVAWVESNGTWYPGNVDSFMTYSNSPEVHIYKYVDGSMATAAGTNSAAFPMETTFTSTTNGDATDAAFTLSPTGWGAGDSAYEASYLGGAPGDNYSAWEMTSGNSVVGASCSDGEPYALDGYTTGSSLAAAQSATPTMTVPAFTNLENDEYVIVWNETCPPVAAAAVTTDPATNVTSSDATLNGMLGANDASQVSFWISTTPGIDTSNPNNIPSGVVSTPVTNNVSANSSFSDQLSIATTQGIPSNLPAIQPNTTYYYVAWANVGGTWTPGAEMSFTTSGGPVLGTPGATTEAATNVSDNDATMNAENGGVDADGESFWVSTSTIDFSDPNTIPTGVYSTPVLSGVTAGSSFSDQLSLVASAGIPENMMAITPSTTYYYVAWSDVSGQWYNGGQQTVTTSAAAAVPAPTADDQSVAAGENQPLPITLSATGSGTINYSVVDQPSDGVLSGTAPNLTYTPNAGFTGSDSFTFVANNGSDSNTATVSITVQTPPILALNGNNPAYVQTGASYSDLGATITGPANDTSLGISTIVDGGATTTTPTIDTTSAGTHTILYVATDQFGNEGTTSRSVVVLDPPTVSLTSSSATTGTISDNPIAITATFSEAVQSFTSADASTTNGVVSNVQLSGDGTSATFDVTPQGNGEVIVEVQPGAVQNLAGGVNADDEQISFNYQASGAVGAVTPSFSLGGNGPISGSFGGFGGGSSGTGGSGGTGGTSGTGGTGGGQVLGASTYNFANNFCTGATGEDVIQLQTILIADGYLNIPAPTGYYGAMTKAAVVEYQKANGITPTTGCVGPKTRAVLNAGTTPTQTQENQSLAQMLEEQLQQLLAEIAALSGTTSTTTTQ